MARRYTQSAEVDGMTLTTVALTTVARIPGLLRRLLHFFWSPPVVPLPDWEVHFRLAIKINGQEYENYDFTTRWDGLESVVSGTTMRNIGEGSVFTVDIPINITDITIPPPSNP